MCIVCGDPAHTDFESLYVLSKRRRIELGKTLNIDAVIEKAINKLYDDRKIDDETRKQLNQIHYEPLKNGVNEGFNQAVKVEYGTPNYEFLKQLQTNTAVFAVFKNHAAMQQMAGLLKDEQGNLRSREDFKKEALKLDATYRGSKLDAEYDTAVRSARMAANWQKYEANKKLYPNLRYVRTKANKPDANHLEFVGIVRPVDDPFWNAHYPPNRWRCQCSAEPTDEEPGDIPNNLPPVDPAFAFNSGKTGQIFDLKKSDYIKSVAPKQQPKLIKEATSMVITDMMKDIPYQPLYKSKSGTLVEAHALALGNPDFNESLKLARDLANSKLPVNTIQILPIVQDKVLRKTYLPDAKGGFNPDFRIDGVLVDGKEPTMPKAGKNTIQNRIRKAHAQADGALIVLNKDFISEDQLYEDIYAKLHHKAYKSFQLYLKYGDAWYDFQTQKFLKKYKARKKPQ